MKPRISTAPRRGKRSGTSRCRCCGPPRGGDPLRAIDALKTFDIIFVMTQGGPPTPPRRSISCSSTGVLLLQHGYASSMAVALFALAWRVAAADQGASEHDVVRGSARAAGCPPPASTRLAALFMLPTVFVF